MTTPALSPRPKRPARSKDVEKAVPEPLAADEQADDFVGKVVSAPPLPRSAKELVRTEGEAPGKSKSKAQIQTWLFSGTNPGADFELAALPRLITDRKNLAWVDVCGYSKEELEELASLLKLHPVAVEAALSPWQRPRIDGFKDSFFISVTLIRPHTEELEVVVGELDLFLGENFLLTVHKDDLPFLGAIAQRVHQSPDLVRFHTAYILYIVLDEMLDFYQSLFELLEERIEKVEETALTNQSDAFLSDLLRLKRYVFLIGRLAEQHRTVFAAFTRPDFQFTSGPEIEPYFRDLQQRLDQIVERLFTARDSVNSAFEIYVSQMAHRTNGVMKLLAVVSTVLLPATLIVGLFGTNFAIPALHAWPAFAFMIALLIVVPMAVILALRASKVL